MTDISLLYRSNVTVRTLYRFGWWSSCATAHACRYDVRIDDSEIPSQKDETDGRRAAWMVAAQAGDRAAYETLLRECIPFIQAGDGAAKEYDPIS